MNKSTEYIKKWRHSLIGDKLLRYRERSNREWKKHRQTPKGRFNTYKQSAKTYHREFLLTFKQFMEYWQKPCFYCGSGIATIGLDRIDSLKGYLPDNIVACCAYCNKMKLNYNTDDFIEHCKVIANRF